MLFKKKSMEVPFNQDASHMLVPWVIGLMIFLAVGALTGAIIGTHNWQPPPQHGFLVELKSLPLDGDRFRGIASDLHRQNRALFILYDTPGVVRTTVLSDVALPETGHKKWHPPTNWQGERRSAQTMIQVETTPTTTIDFQSLKRRLEQYVSGIHLYPDLLETTEFKVSLPALVVLSLIFSLLIGLTAIFTIVFVTHAGLQIHHHVISVLHYVGAHHKYIAQQFQAHATRLAIKGGGIGMALSSLSLYAFYHFLASTKANLALPFAQIIMVITTTPLVVLALTKISAHLTVMSSLQGRSQKQRYYPKS